MRDLSGMSDHLRASMEAAKQANDQMVQRLMAEPAEHRAQRTSENQLSEVAALRREMAAEAERARLAEEERKVREDQLEALRREREDLAEERRRQREDEAKKEAARRHRWALVVAIAGTTVGTVAAVTGVIAVL